MYITTNVVRPGDRLWYKLQRHKKGYRLVHARNADSLIQRDDQKRSPTPAPTPPPESQNGEAGPSNLSTLDSPDAHLWTVTDEDRRWNLEDFLADNMREYTS